MYETWPFQNVWRRDRDLNPGRHHCLTRFRIVRVQPLRHLCKGGGHTDAEAVRPEYIQTDASSILQEIGEKSNRFCALAGDFLVERRISCPPRRSKATVFSLPPSMREVARCPRLALGNVTEGVCRITSKTPSVTFGDSFSRGRTRARSGNFPTMENYQVRKWSKPHRGFAKKALAHPRGGSQDQEQPGSLLAGATGVCVFPRPRGRFFVGEG